MMNKNEDLDKKLNEIISQANEEPEKRSYTPSLSIFIALGAVLCIIIGSVIDNVSAGLCIGLVLGCAAYGAFAFINAKKNKTSQKDDDIS
ncbi:MAG: hypothetical protein J6B17_01735 [Ruminococcus sp.]|nr:hypothetical protein [Ruminococcus sp.]